MLIFHCSGVLLIVAQGVAFNTIRVISGSADLSGSDAVQNIGGAPRKRRRGNVTAQMEDGMEAKQTFWWVLSGGNVS